MESKRLGCYYCFKTLDPHDKDEQKRSFVQCNDCETPYHTVCWNQNEECLYCNKKHSKPIQISPPPSFQEITKTNTMHVKASSLAIVLGNINIVVPESIYIHVFPIFQKLKLKEVKEEIKEDVNKTTTFISEHYKQLSEQYYHRKFIARRDKLFAKLTAKVKVDYKKNSLTTFFHSQNPQLIIEDAQFGRPFIEPHVNLTKVQQEVVRILFKHINSFYISDKLQQLLEYFDAFQAVQRFLQAIAFDYGTLLENERERELFGKMLGTLLEAEMICKEENIISDFPIYREIATHDIKKVEACIEKMHKVVNLTKQLKSEMTMSPDYHSSFYNNVLNFIENWERMDNEDTSISNVYETYLTWKKYKDKYATFVQAFDDLDRWAINNDHVLEYWKLSSDFSNLKKAAEHLQKKLQERKIAPQNGSEEIDILMKKLRVLAADLQGYSFPIQKTTTGEIKGCLEIFELPDIDTLTLSSLKETYRKQALMAGRIDRDEKNSINFYQAYKRLRVFLEESEIPEYT